MIRIRIYPLLLAIISVAAQAQNIGKLLSDGDKCYSRLETAAALHYYEEAYALAPRESNTLIRLARGYSDLGWLHLRRDTSSESFYVRAAAFGDTLLQLNPNLPAAHFWCALTKGSLIPFRSISEKIHIGKDVRFHAEKTIELDSTFSYAYIILAIFEREGAKLSWFERAIARIVFGEELTGSLERSEELLHKAITYDSASAYAYYELARTYDAMERKKDSIASLKKVIELPVNSQREERQRENAAKFLARLQAAQ